VHVPRVRTALVECRSLCISFTVCCRVQSNVTHRLPVRVRFRFDTGGRRLYDGRPGQRIPAGGSADVRATMWQRQSIRSPPQKIRRPQVAHGRTPSPSHRPWHILLPAGFAGKQQTAGIKFTQHFGLVAPIHVKFGTPKEHVGPLGRAKFHANRSPAMEVGTRPPTWQEFPLLIKSRPHERTLWLISTTVRGFYTPNYPA